MRRRVSKSVAVTIVVAFVVNLVSLNSAYAFMGVADTGDGVLAAILANGVEALNTATTTLQSIEKVKEYGEKAFNVTKDAYELAMHSAQLGESAYDAAKAARHFNASRFGEAFTQDLEAAFPDVAYIRQQIKNPLGLGLHYPGVTDALKYCLADYVTSDFKSACTRLQGKTEYEQRQGMLAVTFGLRPADGRAAPKTQAELQSNVLDDQIAQTLKEVDEADKMFSVAAAKLADLREECLRKAAVDSGGAKRSYGVFQQVADDFDKLQKDLGKTQTADQAAKMQASIDNGICAELRDQAQAIAAEMQQYSSKMEAARARLEVYKIAYEKAQRDRRGLVEAARLEALRTQLSTSGTTIGRPPPVLQTAGYGLEDGAAAH